MKNRPGWQSGIWIKQCPECGKDIEYINNGNYRRSIKLSWLCLECKQKKREEQLIEDKKNWIRQCPNPMNNPRCKGTITYASKCTYLDSIEKNSLCTSCRGIVFAAKGIATKKKTGNYGIETKRKNGTLKHSDEAKKNISIGLKKAYDDGSIVSWNKGLSAQTDKRVAKMGKSRPGELNPNYQLGYYEVWVKKYGKEIADIKNAEASEKKARIGPDNGMFGKHHTEESIKKMRDKEVTPETRKKMRISSLKRIEDRDGICFPNYNKDACKLIEQYGKEHGYNFQHAENGGEYHIKELGYFVDGYDKEKNVVIEYDEEYHFNYNGTLKKKDARRQKEIIEEKNCKFIRIKYDGTITKVGH